MTDHRSPLSATVPPTAIVLIGMPGSGKSTIARRLAATLAWPMVDTDDLIVQHEGRSLQNILDSEGYRALRRIEASAICRSDFSGCVVATGGSAVYSEAAMQHLASFGPRVYLEISLALLKRRVDNFASRGIAGPPGTTLDDVYADRLPLYRHWADVTVSAGRQSRVALVKDVLMAVGLTLK